MQAGRLVAALCAAGMLAAAPPARAGGAVARPADCRAGTSTLVAPGTPAWDALQAFLASTVDVGKARVDPATLHPADGWQAVLASPQPVQFRQAWMAAPVQLQLRRLTVVRRPGGELRSYLERDDGSLLGLQGGDAALLPCPR